MALQMSASDPDIRVLVLAEDPLARAGLVALLADQPGCTVIAQLSGGADLAASLGVYRPDVTVWDLGWDATQALDHPPFGSYSSRKTISFVVCVSVGYRQSILDVSFRQPTVW